jgi:hypothetical protein
MVFQDQSFFLPPLLSRPVIPAFLFLYTLVCGIFLPLFLPGNQESGHAGVATGEACSGASPGHRCYRDRVNNGFGILVSRSEKSLIA